MSLFVDTWGWVALQNKREARHAEVKAHYREFREREGVAYTTDYVLDETTTLLFKRLRFAPARAALQRIDEAVQAGTLRLVWITPERFDQAKTLRLRYQDKPNISFTDLTSMVVMDEWDIRDILTDDEHFRHGELDVRLRP